MIELEEARQQILDRITPIGSETVPLAEATGRIISQGVPTRDPIPPFDNTAMDGFVVRAEDTRQASSDHPNTLPVVSTIEAGTPATTTI